RAGSHGVLPGYGRWEGRHAAVRHRGIASQAGAERAAEPVDVRVARAAYSRRARPRRVDLEGRVLRARSGPVSLDAGWRSGIGCRGAERDVTDRGPLPTAPV